MRVLFAVIAAGAIFGTTAAAEFDAALCVTLASDEGYAGVEAMCACLADAAASDPALDANLAEMQTQAPEDRQYSPAATEAVEKCSA